MNPFSAHRAASAIRTPSQIPRSLTARRLTRNSTRRPFSSTPLYAAYTNTSRSTTTASTPAKPGYTTNTKPASLSTSSTASKPAAPAPPSQRFSPTSPDPPPQTARSTTLATSTSKLPPLTTLNHGLQDSPAPPTDASVTPPGVNTDWTTSYSGLGDAAFGAESVEILLAPVKADDVEVKPDGILYLPEIKYRRILNRAFGPGGWGLAPRGETSVTGSLVTREYALVAQGRLVSIARGEQQYFSPEGIPTATEGCKSNALMRCCKDVGIASELWDPRFIRKFLAEYTKEVWVEHVTNKKKRKVVIRKDDVVKYPFKETKM